MTNPARSSDREELPELPQEFEASVPVRIDGAIRPESWTTHRTRVIAKVGVCRVCGSTTDLYPDPAGYYWHATTEDGAPLCHGDASMTPEQKEKHRHEGEGIR